MRPDLETLQLYRTDKLDFRKIQHNGSTASGLPREYSLDQDVNSVEVEERLKGHVREDENGKQVEMEAGSPRWVAQEFEVQAWRSELWRGRDGGAQAGIRCLGRRQGR